MKHEITPVTASSTLAPTLITVRAAKRGRKPGVKTVPIDLNEHRRNWLASTLRLPGTNAELCRMLGATDSFLSHLLAGRRTFTNAITERIESVLGLEKGTIDGGTAVTLKSASVGFVAASTKKKLNPVLERTLTELMATALRENRLSNSVVIRFIAEIIHL